MIHVRQWTHTTYLLWCCLTSASINPQGHMDMSMGNVAVWLQVWILSLTESLVETQKNPSSAVMSGVWLWNWEILECLIELVNFTNFNEEFLTEFLISKGCLPNYDICKKRPNWKTFINQDTLIFTTYSNF